MLFVAAERVQTRPMVDFSLFRRRTFLGASVAMVGFASSAQVMMTYLPLYLQNAFGMGAAAAGFGMLPFALPLFFCPRIAAALAMRVSSRVVRTVATSGLSGSTMGGAQFIVSRIISGDIAGAVEHVAPAARAGLIEISRGSFAAGFTIVLIVAGGIAALGALLTALLVSTAETSPVRRPHAASRLPEMTD
jgi:MFS family permease